MSLDAAALAVDRARAALAAATAHLDRLAAGDAGIDLERLDRYQVVAYDLASAAAGVTGAEEMLAYAAAGALEADLAVVFVGDVLHDLAARILGREDAWGLDDATRAATIGDAAFETAVRAGRDAALLERVANAAGPSGGPTHLDESFAMVADAFRRFAEEKVWPVAERVHRENADIPEDIIAGLAEMGCFGMSVPEEFGGFASGGVSDLLGMVVATEELSRGSLGVAGSLITRPEILIRALLSGGTPAQKAEWLPRIASGEQMVAVSVTEPDHGSDVAGITVTALRDGDDYVVNGVKTWCTFAGRADVLMLLARTDPDRSKRHRGLSLLVVPKPRFAGHVFEHAQDGGGRLTGRAIDTLGYRGMHSYELAFEDYRVPAANVVGGEAGLGRGFYLQMEAFAMGRLQTAARAVGLMQAAFEAAYAYAAARRVFGRPVLAYQLTQAKLARMAALIQGCRQFSYRAARRCAGTGSEAAAGQLEASMVKAFACRSAEWVTREAMQVHGGMGYAEEFAVSRYYADARVLSIFEGADETLALRVIIRRLLET